MLRARAYRGRIEKRIRGGNSAGRSLPGMTSRRPSRTLLGAVLALLVCGTGFAAPGRLRHAHTVGGALSSSGWPQTGQGAYVLGGGRVVASPGQRPVPIASVAKVMTAYLVLRHDPLGAGQSGRTFVVGQADVDDTEARRRGGQSVVAVSAGERLTERQALTAILVPSANNVAALVARQAGGSVAAFVAEMNRTARALGMAHTTYTDPSGYDAGTVSTALDQLRLARRVARDPVLAAVMATRSAWLPVAGVVSNTNTLLGQDGFVGMKTGSDAAAGGCFMFRALRHTARGDRALTGVVLGQRGGDLIAAGLLAAKALADRVAPQA
jgi:D-alanyl-D-alanine carboxypeptidase (penicillin-binding protein 5/6)